MAEESSLQDLIMEMLQKPGNLPLPGGYRSAGGSVLGEAMGGASPLLAMFAPLLDPLMAKVMGGNVISPFGSMLSPTNRSNQVMNQMDRMRFDQTMMQYRQQTSQNQQAAMANMYSNMGYNKATADTEAAKALSPGNLVGGALWRAGMQPMAMQRGFMQAAYASGSMATNPFVGKFGANFLSDAELKMAYGTTNRDAIAGRSGNNLGSVFSQIGKDYQTNPGGYGGLKGGEVGQVVAEMARSQGNKFAQGNAGAISGNVKEMSKALGTMKELFQGDLPQLMDKLNGMFGVSAMASFGGKNINARLLQMKHTARLTGVSMEAMGEMANVSRQYARSVGGPGWGGTTAATVTAQMFGTGTSMAYINEGEFRDRQLRNATGAQTSPLAKYAAGAYVLWAQGRTGSAGELQAQFQGLMQGKALTLGNLSKATGMGSNEIALASRGFDAKKIIAESQMPALLAQDETVRKTSEMQGRYIGSALKRLGIGLGAGALGGTSEEIQKALVASGVGGKQLLLAMAAVTSTKDYIAGRTGYEDSSQLDANMKQVQGQRKVAAAAANRSAMDTALTDMGVTYGFTGMMSAMTDPKGKLTISKLFTAATGMTTKDMLGGALMKGMGDIQQNVGNSAGGAAYFKAMNTWVADVMLGNTQLKKGQEEAFKTALKTGSATGLQSIFDEGSVEGRRKKFMNGMDGIDDASKVRAKLMKDFGAKTGDTEAMLMENLKGDKREQFNKTKAELGLDTESFSMDDMMKKLLDALNALIQLVKGNTQA